MVFFLHLNALKAHQEIKILMDESTISTTQRMDLDLVEDSIQSTSSVEVSHSLQALGLLPLEKDSVVAAQMDCELCKQKFN